jgi:F0F1-type ATP synthase assembly protein I
MFAVIALMSYAGVYLDERNQNEFPLYTLILSLLGVGASMYLVIRSVNQMSRNNDKESSEEK